MPTASQDPSGHDSGNEKPNREPITTPDLFEEKLPALREQLGWAQKDVGAFFGASKISAHRWEKTGAGETEARKAAIRLVFSTLERSSAPSRRVGQALLEARVVEVVTAAVHVSPWLREGALDHPIDWKTVFGVRERLGWTQTEFARFMGVTHSVPAVWESPGGSLDESIRAAILALELSSNPGHTAFTEPESKWADLKTEGLAAFYEETCALRLEPDR